MVSIINYIKDNVCLLRTVSKRIINVETCVSHSYNLKLLFLKSEYIIFIIELFIALNMLSQRTNQSYPRFILSTKI